MLSGSEWVVVGWVAGCAGALVLLHVSAGLPFFPRLRKLLGGYDPDYPRPALGQGETVMKEDRATFTKGLFGGSGGAIILTNRRFIWYEDSSYVLWPFKRISHEFALQDVAAAGKSWPLEHIFGGRRLRLWLRNGKSKCLWVDPIDDWVQTIRTALSGAR